MTTDRITLDGIRETRLLLGDRVHHTPMLSSETAGAIANAALGIRLRGDRVFAKGEHMQKTGSFKPRAALARMQSLTVAERARGAITISAGNAGQAYAWAGREAGVPVTVVMPEGAVASKVAACRAYGAEVVLHGTHVGESMAHMQELVEARGLTIVHPYDQPEVLLGNGSVGLEILEDLPDADVVVIGVGGGGLLGGATVALKESKPAVRVYAVEPVGSEALRAGLEAGEPVIVTPRSVADGLGAPIVGRYALDIAKRYLDGVILVDDATILGGLRFALERMKQVLEPAGAAALSAVLTGAVPLRDGDRVCVILSGGNVATDRLAELLAAARPIPPEPAAAPAP